MPIVHNVPLILGTEQVLRRQGIGRRMRLKPEMMVILHELLATVNDFLEPSIAYEFHSITMKRDGQLCLEEGTVLQGRLLPSLLPSARELAVVVCTIGPRLEEEVTECFNKKEPLRGLLLDGIGSAAVDSLTQEVCKLMMREASSRGYQASSPLSPGMPGFPITEQWQMLNLVPAGEIGVSLTPIGMMMPRKSISMVIGMGSEMPTWTQAEVCARCNLRKTCPYKIHA